MSNEIGQPTGHAHHVAASKGVLITAAAVAAVAVVGAAYAFATPQPASGSAVPASFVAARSASGSARLSASGLDALLNARFAPVRAAVTQQGDQAAVQAAAMLADGSGQRSADGNTLTLTLPAVADMNGSVATALAPINAQMGNLSGSDGQLAQSVNGNVTTISPLLNLTGPHATVSANVPIDLDAAVAPALTGTSGAGAVTLDPAASTATIDLSKLLVGDGTDAQALSPAAVAEIGTDINAASSTLGDNAVNAATSSVEGTPVTVHAGVNILSTPTTAGTSSCGGASGATPSTTGGLLGGTLGTTLNGILGNGLGGSVSGLICSLPTLLLPTLLTSLGLDANGTVGQLVEGTAAPASGSATVLGSPAAINGSAINNGIANTLVNNFAGTTGTSDSGGAQGSSNSASGTDGLGGGVTVTGDLGNSGVGGLLGGSDLTGSGLTGSGLTGSGLTGSGLTGSGLGVLGGLGLGAGDLGGLGLGGVGVGSALGTNGTGVTPGVLGSLLAGGQSPLPVGISATVGGGSSNAHADTGTPSGADLLDINGASNGLNGSVRVGGTAPAGTNSSGGSTGRGSGILGLLRLGTPATGSSSGAQGIINLGF